MCMYECKWKTSVNCGSLKYYSIKYILIINRVYHFNVSYLVMMLIFYFLKCR